MAAMKEHNRLTIAELKNFKGFENYSDEQAEETIKTLEKLSVLFYKLHMKNKEVGKSYKNSHKESQIKKKENKNKRNNESGTDREQPHAA